MGDAPSEKEIFAIDFARELTLLPGRERYDLPPGLIVARWDEVASMLVERLEPFHLLPKGFVRMPETRAEAAGMNLISERWLRDNPGE